MSDNIPLFLSSGEHEHAADRLLRSQKLSPGSVYLHEEPPPSPQQISAVLHALADHSLLMRLLSDEVTELLGQDYSHLGKNWKQAAAVGRFLQHMGDRLDRRETGTHS